MPFVPFLQSALLQVRAIVDGQHICNTLGFRKDTLITGSMLAELCFAINDWWITNALPLLVSPYIFNEVYGIMLDSPTSGAYTSSLGAGSTGTYVGTALPNVNTLAIKFSTNRRGRSYTGRNYWPLLPEDNVIGNTVAAGYANLVVALYEQLIVWDPADFPAGWTWSVLSKYNLGEPRLVGEEEPITGVGYTNLIIDTQRRRLPGRGL